MITPTAIFSTALANRARTPIYRVTLDGVTTEYATHNIKANYSDVILADAPSAYWRFGEAVTSPVTTVAADSSGNAQNGTYQNTPTLGVTGALTKDTNTAVTLNGTTQYISVPDNALLDPGDTFTLEIWAKLTSVAAGVAVFFDKGTNGYRLYRSGSTLILSKQGTADIVSATTALTTGSYLHIVATKAGGTVKLYINGVDVTGSVSNQTIAGTASALGIGAASGGGSYLAATLDEAAIYPTALSVAKVRAHYDAGLMLYNRTGVSRYLQIPRGFASQLRQDTGIPSVGGFSVMLLDKSQAITTLIQNGIGGKLITLDAGFDDIREADYQTILVGLVSDYGLASDLLNYEIKVQDPQSFLNDSVCETAVTTLNGAITNADATITVDDTTYFLSSGTNYLLIEREWISFTGKTATTFTGCSRGLFGSTAAAHSDGIQVGEMLRLTGHPIDIAIALCTNTDKTGLSMDSSLVDSTALAALKTSVGSSYSMEFRILSRFNALEFIAKELLSPISCRPVITNAGKFSAVEFAEPASGDSVGTITDDDIRKENGKPVVGWSANFPYLINFVAYNYDRDEIAQNYATHFEEQDDVSIDTFGKYPSSIDSLGLRASLTGTATLVAARADALIQRYGFGAPLVDVRTSLNKFTIEPGDIIALTTSFIPSRQTGARGITSGLVEVLERRLQFDRGVIDFTLLFTGFATLRTDDFNRADTTSGGAPSVGMGSAWDGSSDSVITPNINTHQLETGFNGAIDGLNYIFSTVTTDGVNQISELEFASQTGGAGGPAVRVSPSGGFLNATGYLAEYNPTTGFINLKKFLNQNLKTGLGPGGTTLASVAAALVAGDKLRIHVHGTTLNVLVNGTLVIGPVTDTALSGSGSRVGIFHTEPDGGEIFWDNWRGGSDGWA